MKFDVEFNSAGQLSVEAVLEGAVVAEQKGFHTVWKGESNSKDPLVLLTAIAARTQRINLGTAVYHIFGRTPVTLGIMAASLDELSGGRFIFGLGVANRNIATWHGQSFAKPLKAIREYVEIVQQTFSGQKVSYKGEFFSAEGFRLAFKPVSARLPIYLAGLGPKMTRLAGSIADGVLINMGTPGKIGEIASNAREGAAAAGRNPGDVAIVAKVRCSIHEDIKVARSNLKKIVTFYGLADHYRDALRGLGFGSLVDTLHETWKQKGFHAAKEQVADEVLDQLPTIAATSMAHLKERLRPFEASAATRLIIPYVPVTDDYAAEVLAFLRDW
ncbi:MAG: LLM class flavin-dependent oxidoreductase [Candidatus Tectomicrobia bacterium]|nr:LLM class flavin-dependent oxidoreductase [Candidatus Tectomicrobia bacterium]